MPQFTDEEFDEMNQLFKDTFAMLQESNEPSIPNAPEFIPSVLPGTPLYTIHE
jgi:hypothetical protein